MTNEKKLARITGLLNELKLDDLTREEFEGLFFQQRITDIREQMWVLYCFCEDIWYTLNL